MRQMRKRQPKFRVGDKVKNIWNENVYTVTSVIDTGYMLDDRYLPFDDEMCWVLADAPESRPEPTYKFRVGDIVQRGCVQYKITGLEGDDYVAIDTVKLEHGLKSPFDITRIGIYDDEYELVKKAESNVQPIEPKFKIGDKVKHKVVNPNNPATRYIYTVFEIENDKYCLDHNDHESWIPISAQDEFELVNEPERKHKFILGDIVVRVKHSVYGDRYFIQRIDDDCYIVYPYGVGGDLSDKECKIWYDEEDEWELFSDAVRLSTEPEPKFKLGVDLSAVNDIDNIWRNTLTDLVSGVTQRNTDAFVLLIDETLKFMDCDAYVDDVRVGMRHFANELKKRLTA